MGPRDRYRCATCPGSGILSIGGSPGPVDRIECSVPVLLVDISLRVPFDPDPFDKPVSFGQPRHDFLVPILLSQITREETAFVPNIRFRSLVEQRIYNFVAPRPRSKVQRCIALSSLTIDLRTGVK